MTRQSAITDTWYGKVVLVNPPFAIVDSYHLFPPLGLLAVARELRSKGIDDILLDDLALALAEGELPMGASLPNLAAQRLAAKHAAVYGFSVQCFNLPVAIGIAQALRALSPSARIVFGGHHATLVGTLLKERFPCIDDVIEGALLGDGTVEGAGWLNPDYSVAPALVRYSAVSRHAVGLVQTAVGCPYSCSFCSVPVAHGNRVLHKPIDKVVKEMQALRRQGFEVVHFVDDTFTFNRRYLNTLLDALSHVELARWSCMTRVDHVSSELLVRMGAAGCESVLYGVESGSTDTLVNLSKRSSGKADIVEILQWNLTANIAPIFYFLINCPQDTVTAIESTLTLVARLSILDPGCCKLQLPRLAPRTAMWQQALDRLTPMRETPYAEVLRHTLGDGVESAWDMIDRYRDIFSSYCAAPGPLLASTAHAISWCGTRLMEVFPLTLAGLAEQGALLRLFDSLVHAHIAIPWWKLDEETLITSVYAYVRCNAATLVEVLSYETWRRKSSVIDASAERYHISRVDVLGAQAAVVSGQPITPHLYSVRRMYKAVYYQEPPDGQQPSH